MKDVVAGAGARLGWTPGQAWTVLPGLAVTLPVLAATVLGVLGQPPRQPASVVALPPAAALPAPAAAAAEAPRPPPAVVVPPAPVPLSDAVGLDLPPGLLPPAAPAPVAPADLPGSAPPPASGRPTGPPVAPVAIGESGWSSVLGPDPTVPAGSLPVQAGPSGEVARSYLRLSAPVRVLRLRVVTDPGASFGEDVGGVRACQNLDGGWRAGGGQPPAAAPAVDPARCVAGVRRDGAYEFDLRRLPDATGAGLSLLPDPSGPAPFRIALSTVLEDA